MVDIMGALATANQAINLAQDLRGIDKLDAASYRLKIADLTNALSDIKLALTHVKEDLAYKEDQIDKLIRTNLKSPDRLIVRWGKAIVGATWVVIVLFFLDYALGEAKAEHGKYSYYWMAFFSFTLGSLYGNWGKWMWQWK